MPGSSVVLFRLTPESSGATLYLYGHPVDCAALLSELMPEEIHDLGIVATEDDARAELVRLALLDEPSQDPSGCVWSVEAWVAWEAWMVRMETGAKVH